MVAAVGIVCDLLKVISGFLILVLSVGVRAIVPKWLVALRAAYTRWAERSGSVLVVCALDVQTCVELSGR
jgi:hypothetical protein